MKFLSNILVKAGLVVEGSTQLNSLAGVGTRMVVTNAAGIVSTQAIPVSSVTSVFGRTGSVVAQAGDYTTAQVTESGNLYYTDARARAAISSTATGLTYSAGVISLTAGYSIPTTASQANWDAAYAARITTANAPLSIAGNAISISQANATTNGFLSSTDWNTFNNKISGSSVAGRVAFYSGTNAITGSTELVFDSLNNRLGVSTAVPLAKVHITAEGTTGSTQPLLIQDNANVNLFYINDIGNIFVGSDGQSKQAKFFIHGIATSPFIDARSTGVTISSASNNDLVLNGNPIKFSSGATEIGRWFSTGNLRIQTGGTFTDDLFKVDVQGTVRVTGNLTTNVTSALLKTNASGVLTAAIAGTDYQTPITNPVTGTAAAGQVTYWTGASAVSGSNNLFWDAANGRLGIGTNVPSHPINILSSNAALGFRLEHATPSSASFPFQITNSADTNYIRANVNVIEFARNGGASTIRTKGSNNELLLQSFRHLQLAINDGTIAAQLYSTGNLVLQNGGTFTDGGQRLQVIGDTLLRGSGATSATTALTVQNSSSTNLFIVDNAGRAIFSSTSTHQLEVANPSGGRLLITANAAANSFSLLDSQGYGFVHGGNFTGINARQTNVSIWTQAVDTTILNLGGQDTNPNVARTRTIIQPVAGSSQFAPTTGTAVDYLFRASGNASFAPTSGSATYTLVQLTPIINQTGTANGITRGLLISPTLTLSTDFRAIETTVGKVIFAGAGNVMIGSDVDDTVNKLQVTGTVVAGSRTSTDGSIILRGRYTNGYLTTFGTDASSGGPMLSYGIESAQNSTAGAFVSSSAITIPRSAYVQNGGHIWYTAPSSSTAIGTAVVPTKHMELYNSGNLVLGGGADNGTNRLQVGGSISATSDSVINGVTIGKGGGSGALNTAVGSLALSANTTGASNTAFGLGALAAITTGSDNVAVGTNAGRYRNGTTNNIDSSGGVYIGNASRASAAATTNEIVIGAGAQGAGNNTVTIGNTGITATVLRGNVSTNGLIRSDASRTAAVNDISIALLGSNITTYGAGFVMGAAGYGLNAIYAQHEQRFGGNAQFSSANLVGGGLILNKLAPTAAGTVTMDQIPTTGTVTNIRTMSNLHLMTQFEGNNNLTVTHMSGLHIYGHYRTSGTGVITVSGAYYGVLLADPNEFGAGATITGSNYGFYQQGAAPFNHFGGKVIIGTTATDGTSKLRITGLPTSATGLLAGEVWNNGGVLNIV